MVRNWDLLRNRKRANFANGGAPFTDARSVSPARPRAFYASLKATF